MASTAIAGIVVTANGYLAAGLRSFSVSEENSLIEVRNELTGFYPAYLAGQQSWSATAEGDIVTNPSGTAISSSQAGIYNAYVSQNQVTVIRNFGGVIVQSASAHVQNFKWDATADKSQQTSFTCDFVGTSAWSPALS